MGIRNAGLTLHYARRWRNFRARKYLPLPIGSDRSADEPARPEKLGNDIYLVFTEASDAISRDFRHVAPLSDFRSCFTASLSLRSRARSSGIA